MRKTALLLALAALVPFTAPAVAVTAKQKMETCKFGAEDQKLAGAEKSKFMARCMAKGDGPGPTAKKPAAKPSSKPAAPPAAKPAAT